MNKHLKNFNLIYAFVKLCTLLLPSFEKEALINK